MGKNRSSSLEDLVKYDRIRDRYRVKKNKDIETLELRINKMQEKGRDELVSIYLERAFDYLTTAEFEVDHIIEGRDSASDHLVEVCALNSKYAWKEVKHLYKDIFDNPEVSEDERIVRREIMRGITKPSDILKCIEDGKPEDALQGVQFALKTVECAIEGTEIKFKKVGKRKWILNKGQVAGIYFEHALDDVRTARNATRLMHARINGQGHASSYRVPVVCLVNAKRAVEDLMELYENGSPYRLHRRRLHYLHRSLEDDLKLFVAGQWKKAFMTNKGIQDMLSKLDYCESLLREGRDGGWAEEES